MVTRTFLNITFIVHRFSCYKIRGDINPKGQFSCLSWSWGRIRWLSYFTYAIEPSDCGGINSTYCWPIAIERTNCCTSLNMTLLCRYDDRWLSQKPLPGGWLHPFAAAVVFCCKPFSLVLLTEVTLRFCVKRCAVLHQKQKCCVLCSKRNVFNSQISQFWVTTKKK